MPLAVGAQGRIRSTENLTGSQKCAILCLALGPSDAAFVLKQLSAEQVEAVAREIIHFENVDRAVVDAVIAEFTTVATAVERVAKGGADLARKLLEDTLGPDTARHTMSRIQDSVVESGLKKLKKAAPDVLAGLLRGEHPQTLALILAHLDPRQAAGVVEAMDSAQASDVLHRVARMSKISQEMLSLVEIGLSSKTDLSLNDEMTASGGPTSVARMLNLTGGTLMKQLLEGIGAKSADIAKEIESMMFVFEDLITIDPKSMQRILRDIENRELALALKAASPELKAHIKAAMSERAAEALEEEIEMMGPVRVKDVEGAHSRIVDVVRSLQESGDIIVATGGAAGDEFI